MPVAAVYEAAIDVPVVVAASDSTALPSGRLVRVIVAEARFAPSSVTTAIGAMAVGPASSVNDAVVLIPAPPPFRSTTGAALTATLKVTVRAGLPLNTALQGFVVPVHVLGLRLEGRLQPANVDPPVAVARNVTVAPLSDVVMFGEQ